MSYHYEVEGQEVPGTGLPALTAAIKLAREYAQLGPVDVMKVYDDGQTAVAFHVEHMPAPVRVRKGYYAKTGEIAA